MAAWLLRLFMWARVRFNIRFFARVNARIDFSILVQHADRAEKRLKAGQPTSIDDCSTNHSSRQSGHRAGSEESREKGLKAFSGRAGLPTFLADHRTAQAHDIDAVLHLALAWRTRVEH